jgi:hypothetical protein
MNTKVRWNPGVVESQELHTSSTLMHTQISGFDETAERDQKP